MKGLQRNVFFYMLIVVVIIFAFVNSMSPKEQKIELNFSDVLQRMENGSVKEVTVKERVVGGLLNDDTPFTVYVPELFDQAYGERILAAAEEFGVPITTAPPDTESLFASLLPTLLMIGGLGLFWYLFMNNAQGGTNKAMSFGKSKAKVHKQDPSNRVTFAEVAGLKEEKEELQEVVDFLKAPQKYQALGARIPKGILMVGLPGTGKTYLSKAVAGEAGVPFYSISGSDFVEMFVGVGASRVRDLFNNAKKDAPCIVFIDEIDAVGRRRGAGLGGGNDEREQTLNQLLVEMDGFSEHQGIIVIAATNRPDILDPALLRPGRFDRQIHVGVPDVQEREAILKVHSRNKPIDSDVSFEVIAKRTPGFTPADLENMINEAALIAARKNMKTVTMELIEEATTKVMMGVEKKSKIVTPKEQRIVSVHEAGHAVVAYALPGADPVHQVTIIPRGGAGGYTMRLPTDERNYMTKNQMLNELKIMLGGRAAEKIILKDVSTGASGDLKSVSGLARNMVVKYAMGENLSQMAYSEEDNVFIAKDLTTKRDLSEQVIAEIDREIRSLVDTAYDETLAILESRIDQLEDVAKALVEFETINGEEFTLVMEEGFDALYKLKNNIQDETQTEPAAEVVSQEG
ncbi:MAG: ATP-dependent zinc metalloprotease FtsH [Bacillota bacterium]|nr:ATP-dependent zinc metalloprotease FtsH [Bacillota bacterium]